MTGKDPRSVRSGYLGGVCTSVLAHTPRENLCCKLVQRCPTPIPALTNEPASVAPRIQAFSQPYPHSRRSHGKV